MSHRSDGDPNPHYSVQGETAAGSKVKGGHVSEDASKQTVRFQLCHVGINTQLTLYLASQISFYLQCRAICSSLGLVL